LLQGSRKAYSGTILFGSETDTWDAEGKVTAEAPPPALDEASLEAAVKAFSGRVVQQVPPYSAVKLGGRPMYALARRSQAMPEVRREAELRWLSWRPRPPELDFEIECSGGTYIRSVARELGLFLGSRAHLSALRRTAIGARRVEGAVTAGALAAMTREEALARLLPAEEAANA
jgi:tRNA pseudouridine55 synthase